MKDVDLVSHRLEQSNPGVIQKRDQRATKWTANRGVPVWRQAQTGRPTILVTLIHRGVAGRVEMGAERTSLIQVPEYQ
jgi:hypothetical protein